jgi:hypothetical protein
MERSFLLRQEFHVVLENRRKARGGEMRVFPLTPLKSHHRRISGMVCVLGQSGPIRLAGVLTSLATADLAELFPPVRCLLPRAPPRLFRGAAAAARTEERARWRHLGGPPVALHDEGRPVRCGPYEDSLR